MNCPFGLDHRASWRCYVVYVCDWLLNIEKLPLWVVRSLLWVVIRFEGELGDEDSH